MFKNIIHKIIYSKNERFSFEKKNKLWYHPKTLFNSDNLNVKNVKMWFLSLFEYSKNLNSNKFIMKEKKEVVIE